MDSDEKGIQVTSDCYACKLNLLWMAEVFVLKNKKNPPI